MERRPLMLSRALTRPLIEGLKPGQKKIIFCSFKRNFVKEAKIAQFAGYVSEHSAYHHGEQSLASTIIGMAQVFVGSNNINLLLLNGQFGTRRHVNKRSPASSSPIHHLNYYPYLVFLFNYFVSNFKALDLSLYVILTSCFQFKEVLIS